MTHKSVDQNIIENEGVLAFRNGKTEADCPYQMSAGDNAGRTWWFNGFFSARTVRNLKGRVTLAEMLAAVLLCCVVGCGPLVTPVAPITPSASVEYAAAASLALYHERLAAAFETLAQEIEQGGIEDDEDLANRMEELTKTARLGSFEAFRQSWAKYAGADSPWDYRQRADICRETARGFRK